MIAIFKPGKGQYGQGQKPVTDKDFLILEGNSYQSAGSVNDCDCDAINEALDNKVDKVSGKGLSANDFTSELKTKLENLESCDCNAINEALSNKVDKVSGKGLSANDFTSELKTKLENLESCDCDAINAALNNKVDKVSGKGLSTNDFTDVYKQKLDNCNPICIDNNGNASISGNFTANNFVLSSDRRKKTNIKECNPDVGNIAIREFVFKDDPEHRKRYGVIAQDIEKEFPEFVHTDQDNNKTVAYIDLLLAKVAMLEKTLKKHGIFCT